MVELVVVMAILGLLVALSLPAIGRVRQAARKTQCKNNLRNIALGLTNFEGAQARLPASGYIYDLDGVGAPYHSWAVSILAYVGGETVAAEWNFSLEERGPGVSRRSSDEPRTALRFAFSSRHPHAEPDMHQR